MLRVYRAALALALSSPWVVACGGDSDSDSTPPAPVTHLWAVADTAGPLTQERRDAFTAGNLYLNAHTAANGSGEIRGQLDKDGTARFATLTGAQEVPPVTTTAFGAGVLTVNETTGAVRGFVIVSGLTGATVAHVHQQARGVAGDPIITLEGGPEVWMVPDGAANLTGPQITAFQEGRLYYNVHTTANGGGEIRGQLDKAGTVRLASLSGAQEVPAVTTSAFGGGVFGIDEVTGAVRGFIMTSGLVSPTAAHIHPGARGANNPPIQSLTGGPRLWVVPDDAPNLDAGEITLAQAGSLYANAHTSANGGGEIRGQLDKVGAARIAALTGAQEVPAVTTTAEGAGVVAVDGATGQVSGFLVTGGLVSPTVAHIHLAARGAAAGPIVDLAGP